MAFLRHNIFNALGKGNYHSCLLTCYSFDFTFFELRVMRQLRAAGIQNILVLTDGPLLEHLSASASGREFQESSGFSIYPIYSKRGVFHPKLALFFGTKEGMFAIGSGNLTSSGMGGNDEAWGCFHVADTSAANAALFADAWHYAQQLSAPVQGMAATKLTWIKQFTPWLMKLPAPNLGTLHTLDDGLSVTFLTNTHSAILPQALSHLDKATVKRIVTVSPYYDKKGLVLTHLLNAFPQADFRCVVEERLGLLPTDFPAELNDRVSFHRWSECGPLNHGQPSRLHAKLIHFATDQGEYLLLGSANVTVAGMGAGSTLARNEEASILLHHAHGGYLSGLGIRPHANNPITLKTLRRSQLPIDLTEEGGPAYAAALPISIVLAEMEPLLLTLILTDIPTSIGSVGVRLYSPRGLVHESVSHALANPLVVDVPKLPISINRVELIAADGSIVGRQFVQHPASQQQYCPDPSRQKLQQGFDELTQSGFEGFANLLLDLVDLDDEYAGAYTGSNPAAQWPAQSATTVQHLSPEEFNQQKSEELLRQQGLLSSAGVHISTFLNEVSKRLHTDNSGEGYSKSSEQSFDEAMDDEDTSSSIDVELELQKAKNKKYILEQKSLHRFLDRLLQQQQQCLVPVEKAPMPQLIQLAKLTVRDLAIFNIALHAALYYVGRGFIKEVNDKQVQQYFMYKGGESHEHTTLKGFCVQLIGNFLLQYTAGFQEYKHPLSQLQSRLDELKQSIFENALFLLISVPWSKKETNLRDLLLANLFHYLLPPSWPLAELPKYVEPRFRELADRVQFDCTAGYVCLYNVLPSLAPRLKALQGNLGSTILASKCPEEVKKGDWLYQRKLGICAVAQKHHAPEGATLILVRPGFSELSEENGPCFRYQQLQPHSALITL